MPNFSSAIVQAAADIDPLNLAILVVGVVALAVVWLASLAIKSMGRKK